jgi:hypothetical protein
VCNPLTLRMSKSELLLPFKYEIILVLEMAKLEREFMIKDFCKVSEQYKCYIFSQNIDFLSVQNCMNELKMIQ